jgi:hypothetical protein
VTEPIEGILPFVDTPLDAEGRIDGEELEMLANGPWGRSA